MKKIFTLWKPIAVLMLSILCAIPAYAQFNEIQFPTDIEDYATGTYRLISRDNTLEVAPRAYGDRIFFNNLDYPSYSVSFALDDPEVNYYFNRNNHFVLEITPTALRSDGVRLYGGSCANRFEIVVAENTFKNSANWTNQQTTYTGPTVPCNSPRNVLLDVASIQHEWCGGQTFSNVYTDIINNFLGPFTIELSNNPNTDNHLFQVIGKKLALKDTYDVEDIAGNTQTFPITLTVEFEYTYLGVTTLLSKDLTFSNFDSSPKITSQLPNDGTTWVEPTTNLTLTMNQNVIKGPGSIYIIEDLSGMFDIVVEEIPVLSSQVTINNNIVTINPNSNLKQYTDYLIGFDDCAIKSANNEYRTIDKVANPTPTNTIWNFRTGPYTFILPRAEQDGGLEYDKVEDLTAYPNPAQDQITLRLDRETAVPTTIRLITLDGRHVLEENLPATARLNHTLQVGTLPKGMYVLQVIQEDQVTTRKITLE